MPPFSLSRDCIVACQPSLITRPSNDPASPTALDLKQKKAPNTELPAPMRSLDACAFMMPPKLDQSHVVVVMISPTSTKTESLTPQIPLDDPIDDRRVQSHSNVVVASIADEHHSIEQPGFVRYWGQAYSEVWKINLSLNVVLTTLAGWGITTVDPTLFNSDAPTMVVRSMTSWEMASLLVGTLLQSCAAMTMNQILERHRDGMMSRTKQRPLPSGRMSVRHAWIQSSIACATGTAMLFLGTNGLTAKLGFFNFLIYVCGYTPLKTQHWSNTWFGSIVGAIPPIMGFTAATCELPTLRVLWSNNNLTDTYSNSVMGAWILAGILFLWQIPHFLSLSSTYRTEYERAGYKMLGVQNPKICAIASCAHSLLMVPLCLAAPYYGVVHWSFAPISLLLNSHLVYCSIVHVRHWDKPSQARKLFIASLINLSALSLGLIVTSVKTLDFAKSCVRWLFSSN